MMLSPDEHKNHAQNRIQIKICGLTDAPTAAACADLGVDAVGLVFYPPSPRFVTDAVAAEIATAVADRTAVVGVFVDETYDAISAKVKVCGLTAVQLHGREAPELVTRLRQDGLTVLKALFQMRTPGFADARRYGASAYLLECGRGRLPGGNAFTWDWASAFDLTKQYPVVLAGGLAPENVGRAVTLGRPDAVDVSSGVEQSPGKKDLDKIKRFIQAVSKNPGGSTNRPRRVFS
jgi:phosphoribosylanthranilate isomerase/indole-3-glycerol phosphate synthase/phosphoribosylanthranilate isomerase